MTKENLAMRFGNGFQRCFSGMVRHFDSQSPKVTYSLYSREIHLEIFVVQYISGLREPTAKGQRPISLTKYPEHSDWRQYGEGSLDSLGCPQFGSRSRNDRGVNFSARGRTMPQPGCDNRRPSRIKCGRHRLFTCLVGLLGHSGLHENRNDDERVRDGNERVVLIEYIF